MPLSAAIRITLSILPFLASIALGWSWVTDGLAQGTTYVVRGWWATLMGAYSIVMAMSIPMLGALGSIVAALLLRLRPPARLGTTDERGLIFYGSVIYLTVSWATWEFLWRSYPPVATLYAQYDAPFFLTTVLCGASLALGAGAYASAIVVHKAVHGKPAMPV